jgi:DNA-binding MarR family transcriptional regulator
MTVEAQVENIPLSKRRLLEYLEGQKGPVTAKLASIDLDSRASTVTEMLERCAAQGLVEREAKQRPRDYRITETGRRRLEELFPSGRSKSDPESAEPLETNPATESERELAGTVNLGELREEVTRQLDGLREDVRDLFEALRLLPSPGESLRERTERIKRKLESSAEEAEAEAESETVRSLYSAHYELHSLGWFDSKDEVKARIAELESSVGKEAPEHIERLVSLEGEIRDESDGEKLREVLELRDVLHLPASVFGRRNKDAEAE